MEFQLLIHLFVNVRFFWVHDIISPFLFYKYKRKYVCGVSIYDEKISIINQLINMHTSFNENLNIVIGKAQKIEN